MGDPLGEMCVSTAIKRIEQQLRRAKMLRTDQAGLSQQLSFATPGFFRLDKVPKLVFLFCISKGKSIEEAGIAAHQELTASGDMAQSRLPAGEKRWLLRKAGALDSPNPYSGQPQGEGEQPLESQLRDGRVLQELASPIGTHDKPTLKWLEKFLNSRRIYASEQGYQTPFLNTAYQKLHEAALGGPATCLQFVLISGKPHWSLLPFYQQALALGRVAGHTVQPGINKQSSGFVFDSRHFTEAEVRREREALRREVPAAVAALEAAQQQAQQQAQQEQAEQPQQEQPQQAEQQQAQQAQQQLGVQPQQENGGQAHQEQPQQERAQQAQQANQQQQAQQAQQAPQQQAELAVQGEPRPTKRLRLHKQLQPPQPLQEQQEAQQPREQPATPVAAEEASGQAANAEGRAARSAMNPSAAAAAAGSAAAAESGAAAAATAAAAAAAAGARATAAAAAAAAAASAEPAACRAVGQRSSGRS
ncbi:hypothetical protein COHA_009340 [Chlorella ohadii]|uniref:Uncharacterized protein n=1 Tax=Chlorella ohadii TaxID=2649997 RepID=A0AAD5H1L5_9CHLO|nr:hypothetical protein COHA_009340 [Chlorella ohadii]